MTTFIKVNLKKSDDQTNIGKYRGALNITEYHIISKFIYVLNNYFMQKMYVVHSA